MSIKQHNKTLMNKYIHYSIKERVCAQKNIVMKKGRSQIRNNTGIGFPSCRDLCRIPAGMRIDQYRKTNKQKTSAGALYKKKLHNNSKE
jgi:hypothetical protein